MGAPQEMGGGGGGGGGEGGELQSPCSTPPPLPISDMCHGYTYTINPQNFIHDISVF